MRFNQKELAFIATRTDIPFDKEGVLWMKEKEGHFWQRNEVYTERWFRLRGNLLFYFKTKEKSSDPMGAVVLERCRVLRDTSVQKKHGFTIVFDEDDTQQYKLRGKSTRETEEWMDKIRNASYESLRSKLLGLRKQLMEITGKDPLPEFHPLALQEPLKPGIGQYSSTSAADSDENPFLEMCIACHNLLSPEEGQLPNAFVEIRTMSPPSTSWSKLAQTEIIEQSCDPYFLTTVVFPEGSVNELTRLKLAVFDVRDREKEEMSLLGQALCTMGEILSTEDQKLLLTLTSLDSPDACGTVTVLGWKVDNKGSQNRMSQNLEKEKERRNSGRSMVMVEHIQTRSYRFPTTIRGVVLKVVELMGESVLTFKIPIELLKMYISEEQQQILELHHLGDLNPDWENARQGILDNHFKLICAYKGNLEELIPLQDTCFKPARLRNDKKLAFVPTNLHVQRMNVMQDGEGGTLYDVVTVGAPAAHTLKFSQGGLRRLNMTLKKTQQSGGESENRAPVIKQLRVNLEKFKTVLSQHCENVKKAVRSGDTSILMDAMTRLSDKALQLLKFREAPLVVESLACLEKAVPSPSEVGGTENDNGMWNVQIFTRHNAKCQELSTLVNQSHIVMLSHIEGMIQDAALPEGTNSWAELLLSEIHDFSRAVDGLVKEIYLGMIFLQLQEETKHASLFYEIRKRQDIVFAHAVTSLITGFVCKLHTSLSNSLYLKQLAQIGFLAHFESLLTTNGDEMGMLEDACVGIASLTCVKFKFKECEREDEIPTLSGNRGYIQVNISLPTNHFRRLPRELQEGRLVKVIPVLFTQGINEHATLAERFGDTSLQEKINGDNFSILNFYFEQFKDKFPDAVSPRKDSEPSLEQLMKSLKSNIDSKRGKNIDILLLSEEICWRLNGCRFTSCKSAKDRTGMGITLEQCMILKREHNLDSQFFHQALDAMRSEGTRRENTFKNTGVRKYAFNAVQVMALPKLYRPPVGTYGKHVQT
ncbi:inositol polyphosphate-4-phosphatase type I A-like [Acropora muricata]|uniref:inositol polyphosphate-4-phosphatase type I A-like n=1 Tax=Acropora muricata TaxID=159855 RepID=UPI0034E3FB48